MGSTAFKVTMLGFALMFWWMNTPYWEEAMG